MTDGASFDPFPQTQWSLIRRVAQGDAAAQRAAMSELLRLYVPAIRSYLRTSKRIAPDQVDDLLQVFLVSKVLEAELIHHAREQRGRFRAFLLTALNHFLVSQHRFESARKRNPEGVLVQLDAAAGVAGTAPLPEEAFNIAWARGLLDEAKRRMKTECENAQRSDIWGIFEHRLLAATEPGGVVMDYAELVDRYTLESSAHASNILITGKRMFIRTLRAIISEYESDGSLIDAEISEVRVILSKAHL